MTCVLGQQKSIFPVTSPSYTKSYAIENLALIQRLKLDSELSKQINIIKYLDLEQSCGSNSEFSSAAHEEIISSIRWDETGRLLVSASNDGFVNVWDMNKQARIVKNFSPGHPSGIYW